MPVVSVSPPTPDLATDAELDSPSKRPAHQESSLEEGQLPSVDPQHSDVEEGEIVKASANGDALVVSLPSPDQAQPVLIITPAPLIDSAPSKPPSTLSRSIAAMKSPLVHIGGWATSPAPFSSIPTPPPRVNLPALSQRASTMRSLSELGDASPMRTTRSRSARQESQPLGDVGRGENGAAQRLIQNQPNGNGNGNGQRRGKNGNGLFRPDSQASQSQTAGKGQYTSEEESDSNSDNETIKKKRKVVW